MGRALVTGGAGFIGHHLCAALVRRGTAVCALDNLSTGRRALLDDAAAGVELIEGDVRDYDELTRVLHAFRPDVVFHLAGLHFIPDCNRDPLATLQINTAGTAALVHAIRAVPEVRRLVFTSSGAVYAPESDICRESDRPAPDDVYGETKLFAEQIIMRFARETAVPSVVLRLFNVYGPGETNPHVIPEILDQALVTDTIALGNLTPRRDYIYVEDVVEALLRSGSAAALAAPVLNIGTGRDHAVADVVAALGRVIERPLRAVSDPARTRRTDRPRLRADAALAAEALGWTARHDLESGLRATWGRWRREPSAPDAGVRRDPDAVAT